MRVIVQARWEGINAMRTALCLTLLIAVSARLVAQETQRPLTNADVSNMTKSGMSEQTIVLAIQKGPAKFDTTPDALIALKKQGVSDQVLNVMLAASAAPAGLSPDEGAARAGIELLHKTLDSLGSRQTLAEVHAIRWKGTNVQTASAGTTASFQLERVFVLPDRIYATSQSSTGLDNRMVITSEFSYFSSGKMTGAVAAPALADYRDGAKIDPIYIAQHLGDYSCVSEGTEQIGSITAAKLKITGQGQEVHWSVDPTSGRLLRTRRTNAASHEVVVNYSDWRLVNGIYAPFERKGVEDGRTTEITITEYEVNPTIDAKLFEPPIAQPSAGFTFKVLQSESVPYVVQTGGGISTNCQISGSTTTSFSSYTAGNLTSGNAVSTPDLRMNCSSSENTIRWNHVLNAMLVEASDGNAYIIACDRAWRWSKCTGLKPGDVFNARRTDKGILVQFFNTKSQEKEATYGVLQAKSMR
jgi:outer membrane lipoprotein-sorting protein